MFHMLASIDGIPMDTADESGQFIGGLVGDKLNFGIDTIKAGLSELGMWLIESLFEFSSPFVIYGCKICIVGFTVAFYLSEEKKHLASIFKVFIIFYLFTMIKGALT